MEKILLTAQRKICLPGEEKTPYRMMANSSYRAHLINKNDDGTIEVDDESLSTAMEDMMDAMIQ